MDYSIENPLGTRYASKEMIKIFSLQHRISLWRRLWLALAESQAELGLDISQAQIDQMKQHLDDIDFEIAAKKESEIHHDVMSHIYTFGLCTPEAKPIIHLGATSCFVTDNSELIQMYEALQIIKEKLVRVIYDLTDFAQKYKSMPCLGMTHLQAAQPTTVGKRATLYIQDFTMDLDEINIIIEGFMLRGAKGTTGTQASFLDLFEGDSEKVEKLDKLVAKKMGFEKTFRVTGQTYTRKFDYKITSALAGIGISASKFANDMRILQSKKEQEEPFASSQVGSSAMAYKRNPMMSERVCALSRYLESLPVNSAMTASTQWFERTLDDSANRRLVNSQAFLTADAVLMILDKIASGIVVYDKMVEKNLMAELPFMATENILMDSVKLGGDRQKLHEVIRKKSMEASANVKDGKENDLLELLSNAEEFEPYKNVIQSALDPSKYIGRAPEQTEQYIKYVKSEYLGGTK